MDGQAFAGSGLDHEFAVDEGDTLRERVRAKLVRQLREDGPPDTEQDDPRRIAVEADLDALDSVPDGDPLIEELAERYLVF
ncbi:hypothetical protein IU449_14490 [Nocardia higoensis]|uniref:Uncharacterized protein n=1 Tax=Nocardia higoensis TaxID=228599 RepID=A0ABS0DB94_9NOCA|nr:hypothetical protein [Nocardia higoensis]